jgi:hypothetical protein
MRKRKRESFCRKDYDESEKKGQTRRRRTSIKDLPRMDLESRVPFLLSNASLESCDGKRLKFDFHSFLDFYGNHHKEVELSCDWKAFRLDQTLQHPQSSSICFYGRCNNKHATKAIQLPDSPKHQPIIMLKLVPLYALISNLLID